MVLEGLAMQASPFQNLAILSNWNHLEELFPETLATASDAFSSFSSKVFQLFSVHHRSGVVEIQTQIIHHQLIFARETNSILGET